MCTLECQWVCRYTYGQPVKGQLHIKAIPQTPTWRQRKTKAPEINMKTQVRYTLCKYYFLAPLCPTFMPTTPTVRTTFSHAQLTVLPKDGEWKFL